MARFRGIIGYSEPTDNGNGVWTESITERTYSGDVIRNSMQWKSGENLNDDLTVNNSISIVADTFANQNFQTMRYIMWMGAYWKITNAEILRPRIILTIGGVYNGPKGHSASNP